MRAGRSPSRTASVRELGDQGILLAVADVVDEQDRRGEEPRDGAREPRLERHLLDLHERRAGRSDDAEEHEGDELAEARVAVRALAPRVEPGGDERDRPDREQPPMPVRTTTARPAAAPRPKNTSATVSTVRGFAAPSPSAGSGRPGSGRCRAHR